MVIPGYMVTFTVFSIGAAPLSYASVAPRNTFKSITKSTATVSGMAPKNLPYALDWYHAMLDTDNNYRMLRLTGSVPNLARYMVRNL